MAEAATESAAFPARERLGRTGGPVSIPVGRLLIQAEVIAYYLVMAPLLALLPARLAYRAARWRGDWTFRHWPQKRGGAHRLHHLRHKAVAFAKNQ